MDGEGYIISMDEVFDLYDECFFNRVWSVKILVKSDIDINKKNKCGESPLHISTRRNYWGCVNALVEGGADVNIKDNYNQTPLHIAARYNELDFVEMFVRNGAHVNEKDMFGSTPLHYLSRYFANIEIIKLLIDYGADVNIKNSKGKTIFEIMEGEFLFQVKKYIDDNSLCIKEPDI